MEILIGLFIIAIGAFCQSSCYVPINKIKDWSWESYWVVQGVFAWLILPFLGAMLAVPSGHSFFELFDGYGFNVAMSMLFGVLWGVGGLTFGLSMRYLGVALGQSIALGTCAGLGTIMGPVLLNIFFPEMNALSSLTFSVILGVVVTLLGIAIIGVAGSMKASSLSEEEKKAAVKDFNFPKGLAIALLAVVRSGCSMLALPSVPTSISVHSHQICTKLCQPPSWLPWAVSSPMPFIVSIRTPRIIPGAITKTRRFGAITFSIVPWQVPCGTVSSSDCHWAKGSLPNLLPS